MIRQKQTSVTSNTCTHRARIGFLTDIYSKLKNLSALFLSLFLLSGCEAALNLEGVDRELSKNSVRTDQYQVMLSNLDSIILVGSDGLVLRSSDEGNSWQRSVVDGKPNFIGLAACPDNSLIALSFDRRLWLSTDNGLSWNDTLLPSQEDLMAITCAPDGSYWVSGSFSTILSSRDQGQSWDERSLNEDALLTHIQFFDQDTGITAGEFGLFYKTTDGGNQWQPQGIIGEELYPLAVHFSDEQRGWAGGLNGVIMHTTDGGVNWVPQQSGVESPIYSFFGDDRRLFASGDHGKVLTLAAGSWQQIETPNLPVYLSTGHVLSDDKLLLAGGWGALLTLPAELKRTP